MLTVFVTLSYVLINGGLIPAVIRKKELSSLDLNTVFFTNIAIGIIIYGVLFVSAPFIAEFYEQLILIDMIRLVGIAFLFQAMSVVSQALLRRKMLFKLQLQVALPASVLSGLIAIGLAYAGWGVWALVWQIILAAIFSFLFYWRLKLFRPSWAYSFESLHSLLSFGGFLLIENLFKALFLRMYVIVIAKVFSLTTVGLYFFAERLKEVVVQQIVNAVQEVTFPALSKLQDEDEKLKENYRKVVAMTTYILFPILVGLTVFSIVLFDVLLPEKWQQAAPMLQLMAIAALILPLQSLAQNIWMVKGQSKFLLYIGIYEKLVLLSIFLVALKYGIEGVLIGQILGAFIAYLPFVFFAHTRLGYTFKEQLSDILPNLLLAILLGLAIHWIMSHSSFSSLMDLMLFAPMYIALFVLVSALVRFKSFVILMDIVKSRGR